MNMYNRFSRLFILISGLFALMASLDALGAAGDAQGNWLVATFGKVKGSVAGVSQSETIGLLPDFYVLQSGGSGNLFESALATGIWLQSGRSVRIELTPKAEFVQGLRDMIAQVVAQNGGSLESFEVFMARLVGRVSKEGHAFTGKGTQKFTGQVSAAGRIFKLSVTFTEVFNAIPDFTAERADERAAAASVDENGQRFIDAMTRAVTAVLRERP